METNDLKIAAVRRLRFGFIFFGRAASARSFRHEPCVGLSALAAP